MKQKTTKHIQVVLIKSITIDDDSFRMSFYPYLMGLKTSMGEVGLTNPVILRGGERFQIVTGYRRILAAQSLGWETIAARVFTPEELEFEEGFKLNLYENLGTRAFNLVESSMVVSGLVDRCRTEETHLRENILPLLGFQPGKKIYQQLSSLVQLINEWKELVVKRNISLPNAATVSRFSPDEQKALYDATSELKLGESKLRQCLEMLEELCKRDGVSFSQLLASERFAPIREKGRLNTSQRTELFRKVLRSLRYPELTRQEEQFQALRKKLVLPPSISLEPPEFFEGNKLKATFRFRSPEELRSLLKKLENAADRKALRTLLEML